MPITIGQFYTERLRTFLCCVSIVTNSKLITLPAILSVRFTPKIFVYRLFYTPFSYKINCHCFSVECQIKLIVSCNDLQYKRRIVGGHGVVSRHATLPTPSLPGCNRKTITGGTTNIFHILKLRNTNLCFQTEVKTAE